jgi:hypothetical protein
MMPLLLILDPAQSSSYIAKYKYEKGRVVDITKDQLITFINDYLNKKLTPYYKNQALDELP